MSAAIDIRFPCRHLPTGSTRTLWPCGMDGRLLVVEYKGGDRTAEESRDTREKELIGKKWAQASGGKAVFVIATIEKRDPQSVRRRIISALAE